MDKQGNQGPYYIKMLLAITYIIFGVVILTSDIVNLFAVKKEYMIIFGILCIIYGLYRGYRNQKQWDVPDKN